MTARIRSFFFNDPSTAQIYTLSLHDALPIFVILGLADEALLDVELEQGLRGILALDTQEGPEERPDRKSTRLNSSHSSISYAVFCLKKKNLVSSLASYPYSTMDQIVAHAQTV